MPIVVTRRAGSRPSPVLQALDAMEGRAPKKTAELAKKPAPKKRKGEKK